MNTIDFFKSFGISLMVYSKVKHKHNQLCSNIVQWAGIETFEDFLNFNFDSIKKWKVISDSKLIALKKLQTEAWLDWIEYKK